MIRAFVPFFTLFFLRVFLAQPHGVAPGILFLFSGATRSESFAPSPVRSPLPLAPRPPALPNPSLSRASIPIKAYCHSHCHSHCHAIAWTSDISQPSSDIKVL